MRKEYRIMSLTLKIKNLKKLTLVVLTALCASTSASAQDRMAALAPSDVKMKSVDTLMLHNLRKRENAAAPSNKLYEEWNNKSISGFNQAIPETYTVDLRNFAMPTKSRLVTSPYGRRWGRMHKGIDVKVYTGDTIVAAFEGKVRIVKYEPNGYGNYVVIRHNNGLETVYGHLSKHLVIENQKVRAGQPIGLGGNTGRSTGSHLHFETRLLGIALNPAFMFDFPNQDVKANKYVFRRSEHVAQAGNVKAAPATTAPKQQPAAQKPVPSAAQKTAMQQAPVAQKPAAQKQQPTAQKPAAVAPAKPVVAQAPVVQKTSHEVQAGETLYSIARRNGMTVEQLCKKNGIPTTYTIKPGETLKLN